MTKKIPPPEAVWLARAMPAELPSQLQIVTACIGIKHWLIIGYPMFYQMQVNSFQIKGICWK